MKNMCTGDGHVVGLSLPLPTDPCDYCIDAPLGTVGCNNLYCYKCGVVVRNVPGLQLQEEFALSKLLLQLHGIKLAPQELGIYGSAYMKYIYDLPDIGTSPLVRPSKSDRLYICRCSDLAEANANSLDTSDPIPSDPNVPWSCAGHPVVTLPHEFDGARAESEADLVEMCNRSLHGWRPAGAHPQDRRGDAWAARLHGRLANTPWQEPVALAAVSCLDDQDADVRAAAIAFCQQRKVRAGMERGVELLENQRALFTDVPNKLPGYANNKTLEEALLYLICPLVEQSERARDLVRAQVLAPGKGRIGLYYALARDDIEWLAAHAEEIVKASPNQAKHLLNSLNLAPQTFDAQLLRERLQVLLSKKA